MNQVSQTILRALPDDMSEVNQKRIHKFGFGMRLYDLIQDHWVRPRLHRADPAIHHRVMRRMLADLHDARVLDLGCGTGRCLEYLEASNAYTGLDLSESMLKQAVRRSRKLNRTGIQWVQGTAEELRFESGAFDAVIIDTALHMIPDLTRCLEEVARVLAPGGRLFVSLPVMELNAGFDARWSRISEKRGLHALTEEAVYDLCLKAGLKATRFATHGAVLYFTAGKENR